MEGEEEEGMVQKEEGIDENRKLEESGWLQKDGEKMIMKRWERCQIWNVIIVNYEMEMAQ